MKQWLAWLAFSLTVFCSSLAVAQTVGGGQGGAPGPAANASNLIACVYIPAGVTPTTTIPQVALQCDANGNLKIVLPAGTSLIGYTINDPCSQVTKLSADFESSSSGGSIITASAGKKAYICSLTVVTSAAANVSLIEGTGSSVCTGGVTAAVYLNTGVTAANGAAFAANGGVRDGGANASIAFNATANQNICVAFNTTNSPQVNVHVTYVQQ